jgi:hypothetical protein
MPFWLRKPQARRRGRNVIKHRFRVEIKKGHGQTGEDREAMVREIEAEIARQLSEGSSPETTRAVIDEIAHRHGGTVERYEDT